MGLVKTIKERKGACLNVATGIARLAASCFIRAYFRDNPTSEILPLEHLLPLYLIGTGFLEVLLLGEIRYFFDKSRLNKNGHYESPREIIPNVTLDSSKFQLAEHFLYKLIRKYKRK